MAEQSYLSSCNAKGLTPNAYIMDVLSNKKEYLRVSPETVQSSAEFPMVLSFIQENIYHIHSLEIDDMELMPGEIKLLASGLRENQHLRKLSIRRCGLGSDASIKNLKSSILANNSLESLNFSYNKLNDANFQGFEEVLEINVGLRELILDGNQFVECDFLQGLLRNESLESLSLSENPLSFECMLNILDIIKVNKTLQGLRITGIPMEGPAPIKENPSGLLSKAEGIILILAQILRSSFIRQLSIDLDATADVQLEELKSTMTKYNRHLVKLRIPGISWKAQDRGSVLYRIYQAIKSNRWLASSAPNETPGDPEIADIVQTKLSYSPGKRPVTPPDSFIFERSIRQKESVPVLPEAETSPFRLPEQAETPHFSLVSGVALQAKHVRKPIHTEQMIGSEDDDIEAAYGPSATAETERQCIDPLASPPSQLQQTPPRPHHTNLPLSKSHTPSSSRSNKKLEQFFEKLSDQFDTFQREVKEGFTKLGNRVALLENKVEDTSSDFGSMIESSRKMATRLNKVEKLTASFDAATSQLEQVGNEIDAIKKKLDSLERQRRAKSPNEHAIRSYIDQAEERLGKVEKIEKSVETLNSKYVGIQNKVKTLSNTCKEEIEKIRSEKDEDRVALSSRMDRYEYSASQNASQLLSAPSDKKELDKIKRYIKAMEYEIYEKIGQTSVANNPSDSYLQAFAQKLSEIDQRQEHLELQAKNTDVLLSEMQSPRSSDYASSYVTKLEDRVAELEREQGNIQIMKKKLKDTMTKLSHIEGERQREQTQASPVKPKIMTRPEKIRKIDTPQFQTGTQPSSRVPARVADAGDITPKKEITGRNMTIRWPSADVAGIVKPTPSASPLLRERSQYDSITDRVLERKAQRRKLVTSSNERPVKMNRDDSACDLSQFLPGEAESVVMSAILQKANESRLGDSRSRLSYSQNFKTLSPVSASL